MCNVSQDSFICESLDSDEGLLKRCVPTQTQIRQQLGSKLSDVFFENVCNEAKAYLGLEPPLVGPNAVWVSPDARLRNKVALTPVPEPDVLNLKASVYGSISEMGQKYIDILENKHRLEMKEALINQAEELEEEFKRRMATMGDSNMVEGSGQCKKVVGTLMEHFDKCFEDLVKKTQLRMRNECQLKVREERAEVASYMLSQLQKEVERRDSELCSEFHNILCNELNVLASRYIKQINAEREIATGLMQETVRNYEGIIQDLRSEMELVNMVDVCRAITQERLDCNERIRQIENSLRSKQDALAEYIEKLKSENCTLQNMATERLKRLIQWRKKVREVVIEFQRFINFALKAVPGQSEYLLNQEKLLLKQYPEDSFLLPEDYLHFKKCIKGKLPSEEEEQGQEQEPKFQVASEERESSIGEASREVLAEETPKYCYKSLCEEAAEPGLTFDYDTFKSMLTGQFASDLAKPKPKRKAKKTVCLWKKKAKEVSLDKSSEMYQLMSLAGENEKEHLVPVNCFLQKRLKMIRKICKDDPEFATIILGCSEK